MPERLRPTFELLEKAVTEVYEDRLTPQKASAMASLAGAMVKIIKAGEKADANSPVPAQMLFPDVEKWYAMIRGYRRVRPRLAGDPLSEPPDGGDEDDNLEEELDEFERKYAKVKLPEEWM